jgi:undecaprenyl-diphosphatase
MHIKAGSDSHGWVMWRGVRSTREQFARAWRTIPSAAWKRWALVLLIGFVPAAGVSAGLTLWAKARVDRGGLQAWDERGVRWVEAHGPVSFQNAILLESFGNLAYLIPLTGCVALYAIWRGRPFIALTIIASYVLTRFVVLVGWLLWDRARPKLIAGGLAAPPLHSYPSGHMALLVSVYGLLAYLWMRATRNWAERAFALLVLLLLVAVVGLARVRLGSHWPSDIMAGTVVGVAWVMAVIAALRASERAGGR